MIPSDKTNQITENEQLKVENENLKKENEQFLNIARNYKKLKKALQDKYKIDKGRSVDEIIEFISKIDASQLLEKDQEIAELLTSNEAKEKTIQELKQEINALKLVNHEENVNARIYVLETDINSLKIQNQSLSYELSKNKEKYRALNRDHQNIIKEVKAKTAEIEDLQMTLNKVSIERDELKDLVANQKLALNNDENKNSESQNSGINIVFDEFSKQIDEMTQELSEITNSRNNLFTLVHKQRSALDLYEKCFAKIEKDNLLKPKHNELPDTSQNLLNDLVDNMQSFCLDDETTLFKDNNEIKHIMDILTDRTSKAEKRIIDAFSEIMQYIGKIEIQLKALEKDRLENEEMKENQDNEVENLLAKEKSMEKENERLCIYLNTILRFIDKVSNSNDSQNWMINNLNNDEIKESIIAQTKRLESFIKQRSIECEGLTFTEIPNFFVKNSNDISNNKEILAVFQMSSLANDILRKYLVSVEEHMSTLNEEIKSLKFELTHTESSIEESTMSLRDELESEKLNTKKVEDELRKIRNKLKADLSEFEKAQLIHQIDQKINHGKINKDTSDYVIMLENKLNEEIQKNEQMASEIERITGEAKIAVKDLNKQIIALQDKISEDGDKYEELSNNLETAEKHKLTTEEQIGKLNEDNKQLINTINELKNTIANFNDMKQKEIDVITDELAAKANEKIEKLKEEVRSKNEQLNEKKCEFQDTIRSIKKENKALIKQLELELEKQTKRANDLKNYYEPLLNEIRQKLSDSREKYNSTAKLLQDCENQNKELKNELSTSKIESKMHLMKLNANDEKMKREKSLFETQLKMKMMTLETAHSAEIENIKSQYERDFHEFLIQVSGGFKEYIDFNSPITVKSTVKMFLLVRQQIDVLNAKISSLEKYIDEIGDIRLILNVTKDSEILPKITTLVAKVNEFSRCSAELEQIDQYKIIQAEALKTNEALKEWDRWAKRVHATVTDEFSSQKSPKELRFAIEEALMSSIGQRQIWRHVEILRAEKVAFQRIIQEQKKSIPEIKQPDILTLSLIFSAVYRLQRLSGHLHAAITFHDDQFDPQQMYKRQRKQTDNSDDNDIESDSPKKYPILSIA